MYQASHCKVNGYNNAFSHVGIMVGDENGNFNPDKSVTRAEMAVVICCVLEITLDESEYTPVYLTAENYSDVPVTHWANGHINKASFLEIVKGYGDGRFGPADPVTCEQAVTMLVRAIGASGRGGKSRRVSEWLPQPGKGYGAVVKCSRCRRRGVVPCKRSRSFGELFSD